MRIGTISFMIEQQQRTKTNLSLSYFLSKNLRSIGNLMNSRWHLKNDMSNRICIASCRFSSRWTAPILKDTTTLLSLVSVHLFLISIVCLTGKLKQVSKIKDTDDAKLKLNIEVDNFSVKLYKDQYDNICKLAEVAGDYGKFQTL